MAAEDERQRFAQLLTAAAEAAEREFGCRIALAFRDAGGEEGEDEGFAAEYRGGKRFHAASTIKVPVMVEVFRQAEAGRFALADTLEVNPVFRSLEDGAPFEVRGGAYLNGRIGRRETIRKLVEQMIVVSDDLAANLLITLCGPERITETTQRQLGAAQTTVLRCLEDLAAFRAGGMNWTTARDLVAIFEAIETGRAASAESCAEMRRILLAQELNNVIPARLPEGVRVAHKTGAITGVRHDAGIVHAPFGTHYLALLSDGWKDAETGIATMAEFSRTIYDERACAQADPHV